MAVLPAFTRVIIKPLHTVQAHCKFKPSAGLFLFPRSELFIRKAALLSLFYHIFSVAAIKKSSNTDLYISAILEDSPPCVVGGWVSLNINRASYFKWAAPPFA